MGRSEVRVTIARPLNFVFDTYTQAETWAWSDIRNIVWTGQPWVVESRMRFEPNDSYGVVVDQVLTHFEPCRRVDFISHFGGITLLSQIEFRALTECSTEIRSQLEFIGTFSRMVGLAVGPAIESGARKFYEDLRAYCESDGQETEAVSGGR